jgi:YegS/Rv2252/BmrU family lipid kinase
MLPLRRPAEMPHFMRAALIFNPAARRMRSRHGQLLQRVHSGLTAEGLNVRVAPTSGPGDATRLAREALAARCDVLVACGGDGTVNEVVGGVAGSDVPLLVIPGGTSNVLAREIDLPRDLLDCAALLRKGAIRRISLGRVGDRRFILMAGIGVDAGIVAASNSRLKRFLGEGAFWLAGFQQLARYHFSSFDLIVDGKSHRGTFALISKVKNYGGPFQLTPEANLFSNQFAICLFQSETRWRFLYYLSQVARGKHAGLPDVLMLKGRNIEAAGSTKVQVQVDGELLGGLPQTISIQDNALSLIVPRARSTDL